MLDTFVGAHRPTRAEEAQGAVHELLQTLLTNRELLLACVLSGKTAFLNECRQSFAGMLVTELMMEHVWAYMRLKAGPGNLGEEYEWLLAIKEMNQRKAEAEAAALEDLSERAHGKEAEAERGKWGEFPEQGVGR